MEVVHLETDAVGDFHGMLLARLAALLQSVGRADAAPEICVQLVHAAADAQHGNPSLERDFEQGVFHPVAFVLVPAGHVVAVDALLDDAAARQHDKVRLHNVDERRHIGRKRRYRIHLVPRVM